MAATHTDPFQPHAGRYFLSGTQALARAALVSGVRFFGSYPGSPITEVGDLMTAAAARFPWLHAEFSINESIAVHGATGASWSGVRALVSMKHVGMHVSCDPMAYLAYSGTVGGVVVAVGTDPGATCSTGEFDVRHLNDAFHWLVFEPADVAEVYAFASQAWALSESSGVPALLVMPAELCTQCGAFESGAIAPPEAAPRYERRDRFINNGPTAVAHHAELLEAVERVGRNEAEALLRVEPDGPAGTAVIASGCNAPAVREAFEILGIRNVPLIRPGMTYPLPRSLIDRLRGLETLYVVQELDGFLSKHVLMLAKANDLPVRIRPVGGRFVSAGALSMDALLRGLAEAFGVAYTPPASGQPIPIPERPGTFCPGCPHRGILYTIKRLCGADDVYGGDIGCSSLPPYYSDWLTCMGSGLGIAHGVATLKGGSGRVYASMGDSTFFHCGMPQVLNAVQQNTPITIFILDNQWTAMTGHQPLPTTPSYAREPVSIAAVVKALGARQVWEVDAYDLRAFRETLKETRAAAGVRVVVVKGPCRLQDQRAARQAGRELPARAVIVDELCHQCAECFEALGCPAIVYEDDTYRIDEALCGRCGICAQMCPNSSVSRAEFGEGAAP